MIETIFKKAVVSNSLIQDLHESDSSSYTTGDLHVLMQNIEITKIGFFKKDI